MRVSRLEVGQQVRDGFVHDCRRTINQIARGFLHFFTKSEDWRLLPPFPEQAFHYPSVNIEDHTVVASPEKPPHHVGAHSSKTIIPICIM